MSDRVKLVAAIEAAGGKRVGALKFKRQRAQGPELPQIYLEAWVLHGRGLLVWAKGNKVGLYVLRGEDGEPVENDIAWVQAIKPRPAAAEQETAR